MEYHIRHVTAYRYSGTVTLSPHVFRLRPRTDGAQELRSFRLRLQPAQAGISHSLDLEGNPITQAWFDRPTDELHVTADSEIKTLRANPYDFLTAPSATQLPPAYPEVLQPMVRSFLDTESIEVSVRDFAQSVAQAVNGRTLAFLPALTERVHTACANIVRPTGEAWAGHHTLSEGQGSCRDLAVLFIESCRSLGVAARFVSGYHDSGAETDRELHAWAEVYLPDAGWRGYDPSCGLTTADRHIVLAASAVPSETAPIIGRFAGDGVSVQMRTQVVVRSAGAKERVRT